MSMFTALATAYGGYGQGRERKRAADLAAQQAQDRHQEVLDAQAADTRYRDQALADQQASLAQQKLRDTATFRSQGLDASGQPLAPLPLPAGLNAPGSMIPGALRPSPVKNAAGQAVGPAAPGIDKKAPDWTPEQYLQAAQAATAANRPDLASQYVAQANAAATAGQKASIADLNTAKIGTEHSHAQQLQDYGNYLKQKTGVDMAKIRSQAAIAQQHDAAGMQRVQAQASAAGQRALTTEQGRIDAIQLAQAYTAQYHNADLGVRLAIAQASDAERYAAAQGASTKDFSAPQGYAPGQPISVNLGGINVPGGGGGMLQPLMIERDKDGRMTIVKNGNFNGGGNDHGGNVGAPLDEKVFTSALATNVAAVKADPKKLTAQIADVDSHPMSVDQRSRAHAALQAAAGATAAPAAKPTQAKKTVPIPPVPKPPGAPGRSPLFAIPAQPAGTVDANRSALGRDVGHFLNGTPKKTQAQVESDAIAIGLIKGTPAFNTYVHAHPVAP